MTSKSKTVATVATEEVPANGNPNSQNTGAGSNTQANNLYMSVKTFDEQGKTVGERIVDLYHFGTRKWLQDHLWWAMHNSNCVEVNVANSDEIAGYVQKNAEALAAKFNKVA